MQKRTNERGYTENFVPQKHLDLTDLKEECSWNNYLGKVIPNYPKPEFHVSHLKHETSGPGLRGIRKEEGFKDLRGTSLIWWSLAVGPDEINDAEKRLLEEELGMVDPEQQNFLWKFATSPAFKETSRLGSFRFTFPLLDVLTAYKNKICSGKDPVMRVYETILYKQEVVYAVLVHSPEFNEKFSEYPLLEDDPNAICVYRDGRFIWRSKAMCETHRYEFAERHGKPEAKPMESPEFYVWDNVALALHVKKDQVLKLNLNKPEDFLTYCEKGDAAYGGVEFQNLDEANKLVKELWPKWQGPLKVERPLQIHYPESH